MSAIINGPVKLSNSVPFKKPAEAIVSLKPDKNGALIINAGSAMIDVLIDQAGLVELARLCIASIDVRNEHVVADVKKLSDMIQRQLMRAGIQS